MPEEIKRSVCPFDCPDACGLLIHICDEKVIKVEGDPQHHFTRGALCPKMVHYERTVHSPARLTQPLLRTGPKGTGQFRPISWEEAISRIAGQWRQIIDQYGAEAILPCSFAGTMGMVQRSTGEALFYRLGASQLERTLCSPAKDYGWKAVMGPTLAPHPDEAMDSDLIILWGTNSLATNIHFLHSVREAQKKRGAKVWLIETYETPTARIADKVVLVRPGTDGALALGMMHVLADRGLINRAFIDKHVQGFDEFKETVLPQYSPQIVSAMTGIPAGVIEEMALHYGSARAPFIKLGSGLSRYGNGAMTVRTITCLPALVGAWAQAGGGLLGDLSTSAALNMAMITREDFMKPVRSININQIGNVLNEEANPPVMSLYVYASNPAAVLPDQNQVLKGLLREDLFTVVHERFMTDTARHADIVLPATTSLEHSDIYRAYGYYGLQRAFAAIAPVGQAKSNWEVFRLLAKAMNFTEPFFQKSADELIDELIDTPTPWLEQVNRNDLRSGKPVPLPLAANYKTDFKTASGKIEILNHQEEEPLPRYLAAYGDQAPFWFVSAPSLQLLNSTFNERDDLTGQIRMELLMNPEDAERKQLQDGQSVVAFNERGEVTYALKISSRVPAGVVVAEGVWWLQHAPGARSVNALTSQRLTDKAKGSTFYDVKVDIRPK